MTVKLVIHRSDHPAGSAADAAQRAALQEAAWEVAASHWAPTDEALLIATDLSADYVLQHFRESLARRGHPSPGMLLVMPVSDAAAWTGTTPEAEAWLREVL